MPRAVGAARVACRARRASSGLMHKAALVDGGAARSSPPGTYAHTRPSFRVSPMAASRRVRHNATATVAVLSQKWLRKMTMMTIMTVVTVVMMMVMLVMAAMMVMMALLSATGARGAHCPHLQRLQSSCTGAKERNRNMAPPSVIRKPGPQSVVRVIRNPCHLPKYVYYFCMCVISASHPLRPHPAGWPCAAAVPSKASLEQLG